MIVGMEECRMASGFVVKQKGKFFFGKYFRIRREVQFMCLEVLSKTFWKN